MQRIVRLSRLVLPLAKRGPLARLGRFYPYAILLSAAVVAYAVRDADVGVRAAVVCGAAGTMSWFVGMGAWGMAREPEDDALGPSLTGFASDHGFDAAELESSRFLATMRTVATSVAVPAAVLAVLAGAMASAPFWGICVAGLLVFYSAIFGFTVGGLARLASQALGRHGRLLFLALILGPYLLALKFPGTPNLVDFLSSLLEQVRRTGARL